MTRNLKVLGLALMALFAMAAIAASAASAAEFHSEAATTVIKGEQLGTNTFIAGAGNEVTCSTVKYNGEQTTATATKVEVRPVYENCTAFGFANTHVNTNECTLWIEITTATTGDAWFENTAHTGVCPSITLTPTFFGSSVCTLTVKPGTTHYAVDLANTGSGTTRDIDVISTATGIPYEEHAGGGCGVGTGTNGELKGTVTVKGFNSLGTQVGIWGQ